MAQPPSLKATAESLNEAVTDRVRGEFVKLIPDDVWSEMVRKEIERFTTTTDWRGYTAERISPLQHQIRIALNDLAKDAIQNALKDEQWAGSFGPDGQALASEAVTKLVQERAAEVVAQVFGGAVQNAVDNMARGGF